MDPEIIAKYYSVVDSIGESLIEWARPVGWEAGPTSVILTLHYTSPRLYLIKFFADLADGRLQISSYNCFRILGICICWQGK